MAIGVGLVLAISGGIGVATTSDEPAERPAPAVARVVPDGVRVTLDRATWTPASVFRVVQEVGSLSQPDIEATLNMGVGMALVAPASSVDALMATARDRGLGAWVVGEAASADGPAAVELVGEHPTD